MLVPPPSRILYAVAVGAGCLAGTFAVAAVSAFAVIQAQGGALDLKPGEATPTALQMKQALEYMTRPPPLQPEPPAPPWSAGGTYPTPQVTSTTTTGTPAASPAPSNSGRAATPFVPATTNEATPQPTTTSAGAAIPTRIPFAPPTIVPIQPLAQPTQRSP